MRFNIMEYIFPKGLYCVVCGKYIDDTRKYGLCDHCIRRMNFGCSELPCGLYYDYGFAAMGYGLYERRLVFNLKYNGKTYMAPIIADIIYDAIYSRMAGDAGTMNEKSIKTTKGSIEQLLDADVIIPVPLHEKRLKERGFNQAEKIANHLGRKLGIPVESKALARARDTHTQRALSANDRRQNMEGVFCVRTGKGKAIKNKKIIVLDDIYTTGATANSCAKALKEGGAEKIYILTLLFAGNRHHLMIK